jgi:hypothetical protein
LSSSTTAAPATITTEGRSSAALAIGIRLAHVRISSLFVCGILIFARFPIVSAPIWHSAVFFGFNLRFRVFAAALVSFSLR